MDAEDVEYELLEKHILEKTPLKSLNKKDVALAIITRYRLIKEKQKEMKQLVTELKRRQNGHSRNV